VLIAAVAALCVAGALSVYAATRNGLRAQGRNPAGYLIRDLINIAVGVALSLPVFLGDYRRLRTGAPLLYAVVGLALLAVLSPAGRVINGARAWFALGPVQLEPAEFAKLAVIVMIATVLAAAGPPDPAPGTRNVLVAVAVAGVPIGLILAEPALGIAIVIGVIALTTLAISGISGRWVAGLLAAAALGAVLLVQLQLLKPYQVQRFTAFARPAAVADSTIGYQMRQSQIAIGAGGLHGQGYLAGTQSNGGFIPEQQTDFVFTVTAEESGFLGAGTLLVLIATVSWRGLRIAQRAADSFGRTVAAGIVAWLAVQSFVNIGMTLGIMPVTGLPLPFVSYGGSAMFADLLAVGLLVSIGGTTPTGGNASGRRVRGSSALCPVSDPGSEPARGVADLTYAEVARSAHTADA
jgi:rod shape determining protein RodA